MMMSSPDRGVLCGQDVEMRTDSLKGQKEDGFTVASDGHWSKSIQKHHHHHHHHHRKYRLINADLVASFR
jgi:hypothetical protein